MAFLIEFQQFDKYFCCLSTDLENRFWWIQQRNSINRYSRLKVGDWYDNNDVFEGFLHNYKIYKIVQHEPISLHGTIMAETTKKITYLGEEISKVVI